MNEQGFHSRYAYDERGSLITYTNNITAYADKEMDKLLDDETNAATEDELQKATWKVQQKNSMTKPCGCPAGPRNSSAWAIGDGSNGPTAPPRNSAIRSSSTPWKATYTGWTTT